MMRSELLQTAILIGSLALITHGIYSYSPAAAKVVLGALLLTGLIATRLSTTRMESNE